METMVEDDGFDLVEQPDFQVTAWGDMLQYYSEMGIPDWIFPHMDACGRHGVLYCDPDTFIMARPVNSALPIDDLNALQDLDPAYEKRELTLAHDAWHIVYASGSLISFFDKATHTLPKVMWQRDGVGPARIYSFNKTKERIHGQQTKIST